MQQQMNFQDFACQHQGGDCCLHDGHQVPCEDGQGPSPAFTYLLQKYQELLQQHQELKQQHQELHQQHQELEQQHLESQEQNQEFEQEQHQQPSFVESSAARGPSEASGSATVYVVKEKLFNMHQTRNTVGPRFNNMLGFPRKYC